MDNKDYLKRLKTWAGERIAKLKHRRTRSHGPFPFDNEPTQNMDSSERSTLQALSALRDTEIRPGNGERSDSQIRHMRTRSDPAPPSIQESGREWDQALQNVAKSVETLARAVCAIHEQNRSLLRQLQKTLDEMSGTQRQVVQELERQKAEYKNHTSGLMKLSFLLLVMVMGAAIEFCRSRSSPASRNLRASLVLSAEVLKTVFFVTVGDYLSPMWGTVYQYILRFFDRLFEYLI